MQESSASFEINRLRQIANGKLSAYAKDSESSLMETYLFEKEYFAGVRFNLGAFQFTWKQTDSFATISRATLVIETIMLTETADSRRAA